MSPDGTVAAVSQFEEDAVRIFDVSGAADPALLSTISGLGLADHLALVSRGAIAGRVFVPVVDPGSGDGFVAYVDIGAGNGVVGATRFRIGSTFEDIPVPVAVTP